MPERTRAGGEGGGVPAAGSLPEAGLELHAQGGGIEVAYRDDEELAASIASLYQA